MFNAELKAQYLESQREFFARTNRKRSFSEDEAVRFFNWVEQVETSEGRDFAEYKTPWQAQKTVSSMLQGAPAANGVPANILGKIAISYTTWYRKEHGSKKVFNPEQKAEFLRSQGYASGTVRNYTQFFNTLYPFEAEEGSDVCTFSADKALKTLSMFSGSSPTTKVNVTGMLKKYVDWCIRNSIKNANKEILDISIDDYSGLRDTMLANPLHLSRYLDQIFAPISEETIDNIYRVFYWAAFAGVQKEDALKLTSDNVNFDRLIIQLGEEEFPIYREAYEAIKFAVESKEIKLHRFDSYITYKRCQGNMLFRSINGVPSEMSILNMMKTKAAQAGVADSVKTYLNILKSGHFYRAFELECVTGIEPDFSDIVKKYYDKKETADKKVREAYMKRNYAENYRQWKMVFVR